MRNVSRKQGGPGRRAPALTQERIRGISGIIRGWSGRLSWEDLCSAIEAKTGARYTRQALDKHLEVKAAFQAYRAMPTPAVEDKKLSAVEARVQALQRRVQEQEALIGHLREKFTRWAYNAHTRGLTEDFLDQPLSPINRSENR